MSTTKKFNLMDQWDAPEEDWSTAQDLEDDGVEGTPMAQLKDGYHTVNWNSGNVYVGDILSGEMHGKGKLTFKNGETYEGDFFHNERHGKGVACTPTSSGSLSIVRYDGDWLDSCKVGNGVAELSNGDRYEGPFAHPGKFHGEGTMSFADGRKYTGPFVMGTRTGKFGKLVQKNGDYYEGAFEAGKMHGEGKITFRSGKTFEGTFKDGKKTKGKMIFPDKKEYDGGWKMDKPHGVGVCKFASGDVYTGDWSEGKMQGEGEMRYADGRHYKGSWQADKPHGFGTLLKQNGSVVEGQFESGRGTDIKVVKEADEPSPVRSSPPPQPTTPAEKPKPSREQSPVVEQPANPAPAPETAPQNDTPSSPVEERSPSPLSDHPPTALASPKKKKPRKTVSFREPVKELQPEPEQKEERDEPKREPTSPRRRANPPSQRSTTGDSSPSRTMSPPRPPPARRSAQTVVVNKRDLDLDDLLGDSPKQDESKEEPPKPANNPQPAQAEPKTAHKDPQQPPPKVGSGNDPFFDGVETSDEDDSGDEPDEKQFLKNILCCGWMEKFSIGKSFFGMSFGNWKRRFFRLTPRGLAYFSDEKSETPLGVAPIHTFGARMVTKPSTKTHKEVKFPELDIVFIYGVETEKGKPLREFRLLCRCESTALKQKWATELQKMIEEVNIPKDL